MPRASLLWVCRDDINMEYEVNEQRTYLGGGDSTSRRGLSREEPIEVMSGLQHSPVARDISLRAEHVERLRAMP